MSYRILCYGDSNTWGYVPQWTDPGMYSVRYRSDERWTGILAKLLGKGYEIIEEGLIGRTTIYTIPGEAHKNGLDYLLPCLLSHRPLDLIVVMLGGNDLHIPIQPSKDHLGDGMTRLIELIQATPKCGTNCKIPKIIIVAPTPICAAEGRKEVYPKYGCEIGGTLSLKFADVYSHVAKEKGCEFLDASQYAHPDPADGVHWSSASHENFAKGLAEKITNMRQTTKSR